MLILFSTVFAGSMATAEAETVACETSARWKQVDESQLDVEAAPGTQAVPVTIGCSFLGVPGAVVDVGDDASLRGLSLIGIRRGEGQVLVAATPDQAAKLNRVRGPVSATLVRDGDWRRLVDVVERSRR